MVDQKKKDWDRLAKRVNWVLDQLVGSGDAKTSRGRGRPQQPTGSGLFECRACDSGARDLGETEPPAIYVYHDYIEKFVPLGNVRSSGPAAQGRDRRFAGATEGVAGTASKVPLSHSPTSAFRGGRQPIAMAAAQRVGAAQGMASPSAVGPEGGGGGGERHWTTESDQGLEPLLLSHDADFGRGPLPQPESRHRVLTDVDTGQPLGQSSAPTPSSSSRAPAPPPVSSPLMSAARQRMEARQSSGEAPVFPGSAADPQVRGGLASALRSGPQSVQQQRQQQQQQQ
eukprot:CAMPEP_0177214666 /NCGR_PEP_ID=MMETSP0367-20130122/33810_1 /TAXON_ID=447022 ORGANISM="Scrippsiella hangoei-like, Strain SHHI-4" /NCGR_SAMPLE_ID=MMETSP0367 /ASSEMBLY_ACC=CAM_ASM_000362 /LENGTH=283 /DNA_ID=CAMNT_0018664059 /DNA_START=75 /DNA_END=923 /DNA_ORIENTATION=-